MINRANPGPPEEDTTAKMLERLVPICEICAKSPTAGHKYTQFASIITDRPDAERLSTFAEAVRMSEWERVRGFQERDSTKDAAFVYVISCQESRGMAVVVFDPAELYQAEELLLKKALEIGDFGKIRTLVTPNVWKAMVAEKSPDKT